MYRFRCAVKDEKQDGVESGPIRCLEWQGHPSSKSGATGFGLTARIGTGVRSDRVKGSKDEAHNRWAGRECGRDGFEVNIYSVVAECRVLRCTDRLPSIAFEAPT